MAADDRQGSIGRRHSRRGRGIGRRDRRGGQRIEHVTLAGGGDLRLQIGDGDRRHLPTRPSDDRAGTAATLDQPGRRQG